MKKLPLLCILFLCCTVLSSCKRSANDVWEDSKTASRQMGNCFKTLTGSRSTSRQIKDPRDFRGPSDGDFIPLSDED